ncbi:MAG: response regulator [Terriglobales bacterium]
MEDARHNSQLSKTRVLFVDDEAAIRMTLPAILQQHGFEVSVAASVPEALDIMSHQKFDVLLTDLNIGAPADGFTLVSAMRRIQPTAATFILTGYPDFQTALEAIRKQVDDYFTKPADIPAMVATLREKVRRPRELCHIPCKRASTLILENCDLILERWLKEIGDDPRLTAIQISKEDRVDRFPLLLNDLANALDAAKAEIPPESLSAAAVHGADRAQQGYTIPLLLTETRILNRVIAEVLQENLLSMDLSAVIPDTLKMGEYLQALLEESVRAYQATAPVQTSSQAAKRKLKSKVG